jgi:aspartyl/glutamyl-tRNA(Asn/Gln) amidotransferase C subunit
MEDEIKRVAENSRINLDQDEVESMVEEFEDILEIFDRIDEIDTGDVEASFHPTDVEMKTREDEVEETLEDKFENTENTEEGFFKGPSVQ